MLEMRRKTLCSAVGSTLLAVLIGANAYASSYSTFLNESNNNNWTQGQDFAEVTIEELGNGDVKFTVNLCGSEVSPSPACTGDASTADITGQNIEQFGFNLADSVNINATNFNLPTGWTVNTQGNTNTLQSSTLDGFGTFDVSIEFSGSGSTGLDPLVFTIAGVVGDSIGTYASDLSTGSGSYLFSAKVSSDQAGAFLGGGTVVPVPAAAWLFVSGLVGLLGLKRLRRGSVAKPKTRALNPALAT